MVKNQTILEAKVGEKVFILTLPLDPQYGETFDALCQMRAYIVQKMLELQQSDNRQKDPAPPVEPAPELIASE